MDYDTLAYLFSSAIDTLYAMFGPEWVITWGIDNEMTDEQIVNWLVEDINLVEKVRKGEDK